MPKSSTAKRRTRKEVQTHVTMIKPIDRPDAGVIVNTSDVTQTCPRCDETIYPQQIHVCQVTPWDWRELTNHERAQAIDALVMATVEGEPVPEIRAAQCRCDREQITPPGPGRLRFLAERGWRWQRMQHVPLDFNGSAGAARWLCPACVRATAVAKVAP